MRVLILRLNADDYPDVMFRDSALPVRKRILAEWDRWDHIVLDFCNRTIASASFLDEIAKIGLDRSRDEIKAKLQVQKMDPLDRGLLNEYLQARMAGRERARARAGISTGGGIVPRRQRAT